MRRSVSRAVHIVELKLFISAVASKICFFFIIFWVLIFKFKLECCELNYAELSRSYNTRNVEF